MKPKSPFTLFGLLKNDLEFIDAQTLREKIYEQSRFSVLYFVLLISSVLVCTLGLLTNNAAIIIGGMLIAPLMWPLARLGYGIAHNSPKHLYRGAVLVFASVLIGAISAYLITSISPIKVINEEILARTSPTLMDLFIALTAGLVAAVAITQKKIADSLAGVAIAVSLMPPLCTVGIALSLRNVEFAMGALILFVVNAACITLITTIVIAWTHYVRTKKLSIARKAAVTNIVLVLILAVPLVQFLRTYSFEIQSYNVITTEMTEFIELKDQAASFENVSVTRNGADTLSVSADLLIPSDLSFTFEDTQLLTSLLETQVNKEVLLNIRIQSIIEPISKNQREDEVRIEALRASFSRELSNIESSYQINSISIQKIESGGWSITSDVLTTPDVAPTSQKVTEMSDALTQEFNESIELNVTFVPRLTLNSDDQSASEEAKKIAENITVGVESSANVDSFTLLEDEQSVSVSYTVTTTDPELFDEAYLRTVQTRLQTEFVKTVEIDVRLLQAIDISI